VSRDEPRFLGRTHGYVNSSAIAADRLEAVRPEEQKAMTRAAHLRWRQMMRRRWGMAARVITAEVDSFAAAGVDRRVARDLRVIERDVQRVSQRLDQLDRRF
jgi:hypothetical protein